MLLIRTFIIGLSVLWPVFPADAQLPNTAFFAKQFLPNAFSFTDQTGVALNTVTTSNSVALTGIGTRAVTAVCSGCTLERNASGSWAASVGGFRKGDTIRIRLTSSGSGGTAATATVAVGAVTSSVWSVTTMAYTYSWYQSGWSSCPLNPWTYSSEGACSVTCGTGTKWVTYVCNATWNTQTQTVYCQRNDLVQVTDPFCSEAGVKPAASQACYQTSCSGSNPTGSYSCTSNIPPATPGTISGNTTVSGGSTGVAYSIGAVSGATSYTWSAPCGGSVASGQGSTNSTVNFPGFSSNQSYTSPGTYYINYVKSATIRVLGGGGGGGGNGLGGGGGGGYASESVTGLSGAQLTVTVGNGGAANSNGGATSVGALLSAAGGSGGWQSGGVSYGGAGGSGSGGTVNYTGGAGGGGIYTYIGGGGGGGAGPSGNGSTPASVTGSACNGSPSSGGVGGASGGSPGGAGGKGSGYSTTSCTGPTASVAGSSYGGGGGGGNGSSSLASSGAVGYCDLTSLIYVGNVAVTANNSCGSSGARTLAVTVNP